MNLLAIATKGWFYNFGAVSSTATGLALIRAILETKLNAMSPALATAWENAPYTPVAGTPYQRVFLLIAQPDNATMGDDYYREQGILQIDLMYPLQNGTLTAMLRAQAIREFFKRGTSTTNNGVTVRIDSTPEISSGRIDGDRWALPVKIRWFAGIN